MPEDRDMTGGGGCPDSGRLALCRSMEIDGF